MQCESNSRNSDLDGYDQVCGAVDEYDVNRAGSGKTQQGSSKREAMEALFKSLKDMMLRGNEADEEAKCYGCGESGHLARACPKGKGQHCFLCGESNHLAKNCPKAQCFKCHEYGHFARDCTNNTVDKVKALN